MYWLVVLAFTVGDEGGRLGLFGGFFGRFFCCFFGGGWGWGFAFGGGLRFFGVAGLALGELEADFAGFFVKEEVGFEAALGFVGDEAFHQVGAAFFEHAGDFFQRDFFLQDAATDAESVFFFGGDDGGHQVGFIRLINGGLFAIVAEDAGDDHVVVEFHLGIGVFVVEMEGDFCFVVELEGGIEGLVEARFEADERANDAFGEQLAGFGGGDLARGDVFFHRELATRLAALVGGIGLAKRRRMAGGARGFEVREALFFGGLGVAAGFFDDFAGVAFDLVHEVLAAEFSLLHEAEFVFPVASEGWGAEAVDFHFADEANERHAVGGDVEVAAIAGEVFLGDEALDDSGAGGGGAEAAVGHGFGEGFVVEEFASAFHGGEQGGFVESSRGLGGIGLDFDVDGLGFLVGRNGDHFVFVRGYAWAAAIDFHPTGFDEDFAVGFESIGEGGVVNDAGDAAGELELGGGVEDGDEAFGDEIEDFLFEVAELREGAGGDDGEVVADFFVIEDAFVFGELRAVGGAAFEDCGGVGAELGGLGLDVLQGLAHGADVVIGQVARVRPRVGEHLVLFVEGLGDL